MRRVLLLATFLAGCAGGVERPGAMVTDSAGVRMVANGPLPDAVVRIDREPVARVGWTPGGLEFTEITAGAFLGDGSVVVFDGGDHSLHVLSPTGASVARVGGFGDGPGEFRSGDAIEVAAGDTIVVYDWSAGRLSLFDPSGAFIESGAWAPPFPVQPRPSGIAASGRLLWVPQRFGLRRGSEAGTFWVEGPLMTSSRLGHAPDTVAILPFVEVKIEAGRMPSIDPFTRFGSADGYTGGFVWGRNDLSELRWIDEFGALQQIARWDVEPVPVDDAVWARYEEAFRGQRASTPEERLARLLTDQREKASATLPYFAHVHAAPGGAVWLSDFAPLGNPTRRFQVFSNDGTFSHVAEFTQPIQILALGRGRVLGIERDELDVQAVVVYAIPE